jgi:hypothetical protein
MKYLITIYTRGSSETTVQVKNMGEVFSFIQQQMDEEPEHREKFTVEEIGKTFLDCS